MKYAALLVLEILFIQSCLPLHGQETRLLDFPKSPGVGVVEIFESNTPDITRLHEEESRQLPAFGTADRE